MQNATQGERVIVDAPQYMISKIVAEENGVMFAESRVSHIIEQTDSLYQKWLNYAMKFCFVVDAEEPFEDGDWIYGGDRKSTRLNSSHVKNSYAVFCLKKKIESRQEFPFPEAPSGIIGFMYLCDDEIC